jgi:hypothetical protein
MSKPDASETEPDYAAELAELAHEAALVDGPPLKRAEVAALALIGSEEIARLHDFVQFVADYSNDPAVVREAKRHGAR